jgi:hypothetical protein
VKKNKSTTATWKEVIEVYQVPLGMSARKKGENVAGREQATGRKETPKQKKTLQTHTSKGGKVIHR